MQGSLFRSALILALMSAVGPLAIDMYLPALPNIEADLSASVAEVQLTLSLYFVAFGVAQLIYGPMADRFGRKPPVFAGLAIFAAGSVAAALAPDVGTLGAARFVQGLGGASLMVVPRAIIRDMHTGPEGTRLMAMVMLVVSVSPMLAPLIGAGLMAVADWRAIFWALAVVSAICIAVAGLFQPETLPAQHRRPIRLGTMAEGAKTLFGSASFMGLTFVGAFGISSFFVFIATASFVYSGVYGLSPTGFSIAFAINAVGFFGASQLAAPAGMRWGMVPVMRRALFGFAFFACLFAVLAALIDLPLAGVVGLLFLGNFCLGFVIPTSMVMALDEHGEIAGLASSLGGTTQMLTGGAIIALIGPWLDGTVLPMAMAIAGCAVMALVIALWTFPRLANPAGTAAEAGQAG